MSWKKLKMNKRERATHLLESHCDSAPNQPCCRREWQLFEQCSRTSTAIAKSSRQSQMSGGRMMNKSRDNRADRRMISSFPAIWMVIAVRWKSIKVEMMNDADAKKVCVKSILTVISLYEWSINVISDSSPLSRTDTDFSPESSSGNWNAKKRSHQYRMSGWSLKFSKDDSWAAEQNRFWFMGWK